MAHKKTIFSQTQDGQRMTTTACLTNIIWLREAAVWPGVARDSIPHRHGLDQASSLYLSAASPTGLVVQTMKNCKSYNSLHFSFILMEHGWLIISSRFKGLFLQIFTTLYNPLASSSDLSLLKEVSERDFGGRDLRETV